MYDVEVNIFSGSYCLVFRLFFHLLGINFINFNAKKESRKSTILYNIRKMCTNFIFKYFVDKIAIQETSGKYFGGNAGACVRWRQKAMYNRSSVFDYFITEYRASINNLSFLTNSTIIKVNTQLRMKYAW